MVWHQHLRAVGDQQVGVKSRRLDVGKLLHEFVDVKRHTVADDAGDIVIAHTAGHQMERKASVLIDDGMSRIGAALKTDDNVRLAGKHIRDLSFSLVAPVGADNCTHHK